jgi:hypothetical protein
METHDCLLIMRQLKRKNKMLSKHVSKSWKLLVTLKDIPKIFKKHLLNYFVRVMTNHIISRYCLEM